MDYPTTATALMTVAGVALFGSAAAQWLKVYLPDWKWTQLLVLGLCVVIAGLAGFIEAAWHPSADAIFNAFFVGFWGATLATFGYEAVQNWRGLIGDGPRA